MVSLHVNIHPTWMNLKKDYVKQTKSDSKGHMVCHSMDVTFSKTPAGTEIRSVVARDRRYGEEIHYKGTQVKHSG